MKWFVDRAKERSTWIGVAGLLGILGIQIDDGTMEMLSQFAVAGAGLAAVIMKE